MRPVVGQAEFLSSKANQKINRNISIFPNPSSSELYIKAPANIQISHWQLYDISGKLIRRNTINSSSISIYDLRSGIYFLSLYQKNQYIGTYKIIKK
nr:T9SS type A sorting domain-containing protein [Membranihabitans maritimus]